MLILYFSNYIMKKDIIFYSNFCTYSKEIINQISKTPINDNILYVCVDDENIQLPNFIKAVPTIYLVNQKRIVVDESIPKWIEEQLSQSSASESNNELMAYLYSGFWHCIDTKRDKDNLEEIFRKNKNKW